MRLVRRLPLLALALATFAGTCVYSVRQLHDAGPWTGVVANTGDQTISEISVTADVRDENGSSLRHSVQTCPTTLLPGQRAAFEVRAHPDERLGGELPFKVAMRGVSHASGPGAAFGIGLHAVEDARHERARTVSVDITNNATASYTDVAVCGVGLDADGEILAVSFARFVEPDDASAGKSALTPGRSLTIDLPFPNGLPDVLHFYPHGLVEGEPAPCCVAPTGPGGWRLVDTGPFSVLLPSGWRYEPAQGIDSFVGSFVSDGVRLWFDYGWYSNSLPFDDDPAYHVHRESVSGREAKVVYPKTGDGETGIYFPDVSNVADRLPHMVTRHNVIGMDLTPAQRDVALQIFRSVRFEAP